MSGGRSLLVTVAVGLGVAAAVVTALTMQRSDEPRPVTELTSELGDGVVGPDRTTLQQRVAPDAGGVLPDVELTLLDGGGTRSTASYRGAPLLLNFWASWCGPCVEEMPDLDDLAAATDAVTVLGVNRDDAPTAAAALADELGVTYDLVRDVDDELFAATGGFGMPTTLLVDGRGQIVHRHTGVLTRGQLRELLSRHLGIEVAA